MIAAGMLSARVREVVERFWTEGFGCPPATLHAGGTEVALRLGTT